MRTEGSPAVLEYRRRLAVQRVEDGYSIGEVADFLGVDRRTVRRWVAAFRQHGADGLVLFNRFYQPDLDLDTLGVVHRVELSRSWELRLPLRWIGILRPQLGPETKRIQTPS